MNRFLHIGGGALIGGVLFTLASMLQSYLSGWEVFRAGTLGPAFGIGALAGAIAGFIYCRRVCSIEASLEEEKYKDLYEEAPIAYFSVGVDGLIKRANKRAVELLGYSHNDLMGRPVFQLYADTPSGKEKAKQIFNRFKQGEHIRSEELQMQRADGEQIWISLSVRPIRDDQGRIIESRSMVEDITDHKLSDEELRRHRDRLEELVEDRTKEMSELVSELQKKVDERRQVEDVLRKSEANLAEAQRIAHLGSWDWNIETNELHWSDEIYRIFGLSPREFGATYDAFMNSVHPEDREHVQKSVDAAVKGDTEYSIDHRIVLPSGEVRHVHEQGEVSRDENGRPLRMLGTVIDITERKQAEQALLTERQRLYWVLETLPASIHLVSKDHSIPFANRQFREYFGDPKGRTCYEIMEGKDRPCADCATFEVFETSDLVMEERARINDRIYEIYFIPFTDADGSRLVLEMAFDITDKKAAEKAREDAERELEEQRARAILVDRLRSLGQMAAGIAHELNQPLLGVRGLAEHILIALERDWKMSEESVREKVNLIIEQADRMSHVIEHARMFARGADNSERIPVKVNEVIRSGLGLIGAQLKSRGIELKTDLAQDIPLVIANPFSLEEVVLNLITNARDAVEDRMAREGESFTPVIFISSFPENEGMKVKFQVRDTGGGMPHDIMDKVFEPFFTTKGPDTGTGLGLAISRSIIEEFKGSIEIDSKTGEGLTVTVSLPAINNKRE